jgi:DNA polymerase III delta subunit
MAPRLAREESVPNVEMRPVVVLLGDEAALIDDAVSALRAQAVPGAAAAFNAAVFRAEDGPDGPLSMARTQPMMSRFRFVEVRSVEDASSDTMDALAAYIANPSPSAVFVVRGTKLGNTKAARALRKAAKDAGALVEFRSRDQRPDQLAASRAEAAGCHLEPSAVRRLIELTGKDTARLRMEVDKLICAVGGSGSIGVKDVEEACSLVAEAVVWELTDAIVARDSGRAMAACERLLGGGNTSRSAHQLLSMVAWQMRDLLALQEAIRANAPPPGRWSRLPGSKLRAAKDTLRRRPIDPARVTRQLARANHALNRSRGADREVFEGLVLEMTRL